MTDPTDDIGPTTAWPPATSPTAGAVGPTADRPGPRDESASDTGNVAKEQASQVKDAASGAAQDVASTVKDQTRNVVGEAQEQARGLLDQVKTEATSQAGTQQQRVAGLLGDYATELQGLASGEQTSGPITDLARRGGDKAQEFSTWLEHHEPGDLLDEVRAFARRRPVAFLIGAAVAGVVVGRATRGFASNAKAEQSTPAGRSTQEVTARTTSGSSSLDVPPATAGEGSVHTDPYGYDDALAYESVEPVPPTPYAGRDDVIR